MMFPYQSPVRHMPVLDPDFRSISLDFDAFDKAVLDSGNVEPIAIAIDRGEGLRSVFRTRVFRVTSDEAAAGSDEVASETGRKTAGIIYVERLVKTLLWLKGGFRVTIAGPGYLAQEIRAQYATGGARAFDAAFMARVYEHPFEVLQAAYEAAPSESELSAPVGRHLDGCRIGFDAGGSDRKVSAVVDGQSIYSEEVVWHPKLQSDPDYHYREILTAMRTAASKMPRVDAIGVSSAGIYRDNRVMVASLFLKVPDEAFDAKVKDIFLRVRDAIGDVPIEVSNDGDVTALAGAMNLNDNNVLGIAMGTSEAAGYVNAEGNLTGWLNELAFVPVDLNPDAMIDEWSGDTGCGVKSFSQDGVIRLAQAAGIPFVDSASPAERLKVVQTLLESGDPRAETVFRDIGRLFGYALGWYARFYDMRHILVLGRVTSGRGGLLVMEEAERVLQDEFPALADSVKLHLPDEDDRRVGQSVAAASLPNRKPRQAHVSRMMEAEAT